MTLIQGWKGLDTENMTEYFWLSFNVQVKGRSYKYVKGEKVGKGSLAKVFTVSLFYGMYRVPMIKTQRYAWCI